MVEIFEKRRAIGKACLGIMPNHMLEVGRLLFGQLRFLAKIELPNGVTCVQDRCEDDRRNGDAEGIDCLQNERGRHSRESDRYLNGDVQCQLAGQARPDARDQDQKPGSKRQPSGRFGKRAILQEAFVPEGMDKYPGDSRRVRRGHQISQLNRCSADQDVPVTDQGFVEPVMQHVVKADRVNLVQINAIVDLEITNVSRFGTGKQPAQSRIIALIQNISAPIFPCPAV